MILFFIVYIVLALIGISFVSKDDDFLSFDQTNALKGIGIMTVFFNHVYNDYLTPNNVLHHTYLDEPFVFFESIMTGLFVGMFLFFSGYGVLESVKKKGATYINQMPVKRIGTTLFNFDIAVLVFLIANLLLHISFTHKHVLLSFLGWESIGNSNWYIFAYLCCCCFSYIALKVCTSQKIALVLIFLLVIVYYLLVSLYKQPWWHNTIFCYPAGMLYSEYKGKINLYFKQRYYLCCIVVLVVFIATFAFSSNTIMCNIASVAFCLLCVLFSMRVSLNSKPLIWLGANLFPLYIYQRLPMYVIGNWHPEVIKNAPYIFLFICIAITLIIGRFVPVLKLGKK